VGILLIIAYGWASCMVDIIKIFFYFAFGIGLLDL